MAEIREIITKMLEGNIKSKQNILGSPEIIKQIEEIVDVIIRAYERGNKVIAFGNGGSACDALHLAGELVGRYKNNRKSLRAIALVSDPAIVTCIGNDYGYENIFARQIEAQVDKGDVVIGYSTSGTSKNVILGLKKAKELGAVTIGVGGGSGGELPLVCELVFLVPTDKCAHMQEGHLALTHILCEAIDKYLGTS